MDKTKQTQSQQNGSIANGEALGSADATPTLAPIEGVNAQQIVVGDASSQATAPQPSTAGMPPATSPQVTRAPFGHVMSEEEAQVQAANNSTLASSSMWSEPSGPSDASDRPMPVVKVLSVKGLEYLFMSFGLWFAAGALIVMLLMIVNGVSSFNELSFPSAILIASLPVFVVFFLRLRKAENNDASLTLDPSKRRMSQITQILAFVACFFNFTAFVYNIMRSIGGEQEVSLLKSFLSLLIVTVIAGGVLVYYWFNEHRAVN